jgi:hypothetical protein
MFLFHVLSIYFSHFFLEGENKCVFLYCSEEMKVWAADGFSSVSYFSHSLASITYTAP